MHPSSQARPTACRRICNRFETPNLVETLTKHALTKLGLGRYALGFSLGDRL